MSADDSSSQRSRNSIAKIKDSFWDGYSIVDATAKNSVKTAKSSGFSRSAGLIAKHVFLLAVVISSIVLLVVVGQIPSWQSTSKLYKSRFDNCNANGTFTPQQSPTFSLWDKSGLFQITLNWGVLTFSQAKAIDVAWDIVIGRGVQAIFLYVAFKTFSFALSRNIEESPVSYGTFESMAFTSPTFVSPWILCRDFFTNKGIRAKLAVAWAIIASLFVLAFPTLNDTMSGYSTNMQAFLEDKSGTLVPWSNYTMVQFVIHDGERIGLQSPTWVTDNPQVSGSCASFGPQLFTYTRNSSTGAYDKFPVANQTQAWETVPKNCTTFWDTVKYANTYGFDGQNSTTSVFQRGTDTQTLLSPTLNITSSYTDAGFAALADTYNGFPDGDTNVVDLIQDDLSKTLWVWAGGSYNLSYVQAHGQCHPLMTHNWGFSFLGLYVVMFMTAIFAIGMYAMWIDAYLNSRFARANRNLGTFRASWDFAEAMKRDMGDDAITETMSNSEVKARVRKARNGNRILYQMDDPAIPISRLDELRIWWKGVEVRRRVTGGQKHRPTPLEPFAQEEDRMLDSSQSSSTSSAFLSPWRSPLPTYTAYSPDRFYTSPAER